MMKKADKYQVLKEIDPTTPGTLNQRKKSNEQ